VGRRAVCDLQSEGSGVQGVWIQGPYVLGLMVYMSLSSCLCWDYSYYCISLVFTCFNLAFALQDFKKMSIDDTILAILLELSNI